MLTLVILKFHKTTILTVYFDQNCGICMKVYKIFETLNSSYLKLSLLQEANNEINQEMAYTYIASKSMEKSYYGYDTYHEILSRIPVFSLLYPIMKLELVSKIGRSIYRKVANSRTCKIS
ncbi:DCC1-like thiol-disulfide oxidoreductase family protein [Marivirga arenosa]|nr:DCC1-like thiol-disulfide oxidoreductase family protein [Marivirga sp. ABR2-2]WMN08067.1 DCC1-like thiol-disulfide oxidoreductase family protein [Marivirga sp. ABR2-2]